MLNLIIHAVYFDNCDSELDPVPMAHFNIDDKCYDMVPLNDDFTLDQTDKQTVKKFNQADINAINIAIKDHIKNEQKLDETNEKINNLILAILEKTNHELRLLKKNDSYIISELDREKNKWNILQILSNRMQTEMYLENLLNNSKKVVKRLNANISEYLHDSFRVKCQEKKLDMQEVLEEMIRDYIK
jgi:hypothetical protein